VFFQFHNRNVIIVATARHRAMFNQLVDCSRPDSAYLPGEHASMKHSQHFLENAENCAQLAERTADEPTHKRYKRMEAVWTRAGHRRGLARWRDTIRP